MGDVVAFTGTYHKTNRDAQDKEVMKCALHALSTFNFKAATKVEVLLTEEIDSDPRAAYHSLAEILLLDQHLGIGTHAECTAGNLLSAIHRAVLGEIPSRNERIDLSRQVVNTRRERGKKLSYLDALYYAVEATLAAGGNASASAHYFVHTCVELRHKDDRAAFTESVCMLLVGKLKT